MNKPKMDAADEAVKEDLTADQAGAIEEKTEPLENRMYIGPTIPGLVRHGMVFKDGIFTKRINAALEEEPSMIRLFVRMEELPKMLRKAKNPSSSVWMICRKVEKKFKEGN